ncbi:MAG: ATP-binding protein [Leptolyngbyaceae cyanobacterium SL_1_1]|nr:ATP-binding protein [Leptolyngbyaceae cyanobacterium SL_1_1]
MKLIQKRRFQTRTDLKDLDKVLAWFDQLQTLARFIPENTWLQCQLALVEGFTNAVRHAHHNLAVETPIDIEVAIFSGFLEIYIWDRGPGFDVQSWLRKTPQVVDKDSEGGRGLRLMERIADRFTYTSEANGKNCLYISKSYHP